MRMGLRFPPLGSRVLRHLGFAVAFALALTACRAGGADTPGDWLKAELKQHRTRLGAALDDYRMTRKPMHEFEYDWGPELLRARMRIDSTKGAVRREALCAYLDLGFGAYGAVLDRDVVTLAIREIPATSPFWSLDPYLLETVAATLGGSAEFADYIARVATKHPDPEVRNVASSRIDPLRPVAPGRPVPDFVFESADIQDVAYSNASLKGRVYLIDFWATWCGPCLAEMSGLHAAEKEFGERGFQILSVSLDNADTLARFRREQWPMPWLHAIASDGLNDPRLKGFRISGLPMPILVDDHGIILAVGLPLRGPRLLRTLRAVFSPGP